jgi:hypothetical protein
MNRVRKYLLPRLLMPSNFCLPPVEYSPGTIPIQASLTSTCRRHEIDPQLYLTQLLVNLPS